MDGQPHEREELEREPTLWASDSEQEEWKLLPGRWGPGQATFPSHQSRGLRSGKNNRGQAAASAAVCTAHG